MIEKLSSEKRGVRARRRIVLQLVEQTCFRGSRRGGRLGRREGIEDIGRKGELCRQRSGRLREQCGQEVRSNGCLSGS